MSDYVRQALISRPPIPHQIAILACASSASLRTRWAWCFSGMATLVLDRCATARIGRRARIRSEISRWRSVYADAALGRPAKLTASLIGCLQASLFQVSTPGRAKIDEAGNLPLAAQIVKNSDTCVEVNARLRHQLNVEIWGIL